MHFISVANRPTVIFVDDSFGFTGRKVDRALNEKSVPAETRVAIPVEITGR